MALYNVIKKINRLKPDRDYEPFYIGTESKFVDSNDSSLLIHTGNTTLDKILPLKINQETIDDSNTSISSLNDIKKQGLYYISKTNIIDKPNNITVPFNLLVLTNGDSFKQILFKEEKIYIRDNFSSAWSAALAEPFTGSNTTNSGTKGLVPAPKTTETGNFFLNANGKWTSLNNITFTSVGNNTPTFNNGFTSQGAVSIIADDSTERKALRVTHGISAENISASGNGNFGSINIGDTTVIDGSCIGNFASITSTSGISITNGGITADNGVGKFASVSASGNISTTGGNISTSKGDISTDNGNITATGSISTDNGNISATGSISTTNGNISASGNGKFGSINIGDTIVIDGSRNGNFADVTGTGKGSFSNLDINSKVSITSEGIVNITNNTDASTDSTPAGALKVTGGIYSGGKIYANNGVYNAYWNDLADSIVVNKDAEIEAGYCYCLKNNKYIKSSKYLDNGIIGIHSDTYGFKMGEKAGEKQLDCAVAGFVLAYVDKDYLPGTALTCTKDGHLTKMKSKDKQKFPEKIVATYWKDEPNEEWGSDNRKVKVNGRKWVKIK